MAETRSIPGVQILKNPVFSDDRGFFLEFWKTAMPGTPFVPDSAATSLNEHRHTLRGMHFQAAPHAQAKLVFCSQGRAYDVALDLRADSPTYLQWQSVELSPAKGTTIFIPKGCAHGFLTMEPNTVITYLIEGAYAPESSGFVRWNDPCHDIVWPVDDPVMSDRDRLIPDFKP